jgi:hypothetical protein
MSLTRMALLGLGLLALLHVGADAQQPPPPSDAQTQWGACLNRESQQQTLTVQRHEALIVYFQTEMRKAVQERDEARKQVEEMKKAFEKEKS